MKKAVLIFAVMSFVLALACVSCSNGADGGGSNPAATTPSSGGTENPSGDDTTTNPTNPTSPTNPTTPTDSTNPADPSSGENQGGNENGGQQQGGNTGGQTNASKKVKKRAHFKDFFADGSEGTEQIYTYDEKGNETSQYLVYHQFSYLEPTTRTFINEYDQKEFLIKQTMYSGDNIAQIEIYENNLNGIPTKRTTSYNNSRQSIAIYNENGLIHEVKSYNDTELVSTLVYEYDNFGNTLKNTSTDKDGNIGINAYEYKDGHSYEVIKYWYSYNGEIITYKEYTNIYQLDSYGNLLHVERTDQTGEKEIRDIEYY